MGKIYPSKSNQPQYVNFYQYPPPAKFYLEDEETFIFLHQQLEKVRKVNTDKYAIYISVPFCFSRCNSCLFFRNLVPKGDKQELDTYLDAIIYELSTYLKTEYFKGRRIGAIYIGGGTGSTLSVGNIRKTIEKIKSLINLEDVEITLEGNPRDFSVKNYLPNIKKAGITRVSIGLQSCSAARLSALGSPHTDQQGIDAMRIAGDEGFDSVNVDLLLATPGQTIQEWLKDVRIVCENTVGMITINKYDVHSGSKAERLISSGILPSCINSDTADIWYMEAKSILTSYGYIEAYWGRFVLPGHTHCYGDMVYLEGSEFIGVGVGSYGWFLGREIYNPTTLANYLTLVNEKGGLSFDSSSNPATSNDLAVRWSLFNLNTGRLSLSELRERFGGESAVRYIRQLLNPAINDGRLEWSETLSMATLTQTGLKDKTGVRWLLYAHKMRVHHRLRADTGRTTKPPNAFIGSSVRCYAWIAY